MAHRSVTGISCRVAGRHGAAGTLLGLLLSVLLPVVAWGFPSFEPFTDATASGGTAYTTGSGLYHQTNALGESWSLWNGGSGSTLAEVMCVNNNLAYNGFPADFRARRHYGVRAARPSSFRKLWQPIPTTWPPTKSMLRSCWPSPAWAI